MTPVLAQAAALLVAFAEPGFPVVDARPTLPDIPAAVVATDVRTLDSLLRQPGAVLVWRHGSAFPLEAWPALRRFFESGGNLLHLGGEPFTRPVSGAVGARAVGPRTVTFLKALRLNQSHALAVERGTVSFLDPLQALGARALPPETTVWTLEPKLAGPPRFADEEGSPGRRDGVVRALSMVRRDGDDPRFPAAAGALVLDWHEGPYAGGRWVLRTMSVPPAEDELTLLLGEATKPPLEVRVMPDLGTFHAGERPSVHVRWRSSASLPPAARAWDLTLTDTLGSVIVRRSVALDSAPAGMQAISLAGVSAPGLYRVHLRAAGYATVTTGFWILDPVLFSSGDSLSFDGHTLRRNGHPEPVVGTTVMSRTVHRDFLDEPDAAVWDDTFAELAALDMNLVRTGVWAGWESILHGDSVDEGWMRALEAYYLSARRHGIPVLFTFFAFMPPAYGGESPYFDPRSLEGQRAYVRAVARRFAPAREMMWDLINEPSVASPRHVWQTRPNGDPRELEAFRAWLRNAFGNGDPSDTSWAVTVRERWRLAPDAPIGVPVDGDFADVNIFGDRHPYRARDFARFAGDAFRDWALDLRQTIRDAGSRGAVSVGQDEGGLFDRPTPASHAAAVDFTSIHTWWLNDALVWDGLMARAPGKPLLVSETGIMRRELLSGAPLRTPEASAALLARKVGAAFAAGAFGAIEWVYDVNPYMDSDNEVAIGLRRPDGSYKPEHTVLRRFADFVYRNRARFDQPRDPDVVLVVPTAELRVPRPLGAAATQHAVTALTTLGVAVRLVADADLPAALHTPKLIILPGNSGLSDSAWQAITGAVEHGATLLASGWIEQDDAGLPAYRLGTTPRLLGLVERLDAPWIDAMDPLRYPLDIAQSVRAAQAQPAIRRQEAGQVISYPVPLEWVAGGRILEAVYAHAVTMARVPRPVVHPSAPEAGIAISATPFADAVLVAVLNEQGQDREVVLATPDGAELRVRVGAGGAQMLWVSLSGEVLDALDRDAVRAVRTPD